MSDAAGIDTALQRALLDAALRNGRRTVPLLVAAVLIIVTLAHMYDRPLAGWVVLALGLAGAAWRWQIGGQGEGGEDLSLDRIRLTVRAMELNAALVGVMWVVATTAIYPQLQNPWAELYIGIVCGSVASAAFFMSMAGRSFALLTALQLGSLAAVCAFEPQVRSFPLAALAVIFGFTMLRATREFRGIAEHAIRHGLEADAANDSLLRAKAAAEAANMAKSQFLATMSHEIRTPMNGVLGALDLLRETPLDNRQRRLVRTAAASGASLMDILNDVLDHSKIEAGKLVLVPSPVSLHSILGSAAALFRDTAVKRGLRVELDVDEALPDGVMIDGQRLKQVLLNLVGNAVKFTESGEVVLKALPLPAAPGQARVHFEVRDTGIGISADDQATLFQPFFQVDGSQRRVRGGTGLGLSISQRIAQAMGGQVQVASAPRKGTRFWFELTMPLVPDWTPPTPVDSHMGALDGATGMLHGTVLLVEDNLVNRMIGVEMLRGFGLEVQEAEDGQRALELMRERHFDLVLMDIQMPVMDGYTATAHVREREARLRLPRVPIVALTANAFDEDAAQSLSAGMDAHLAKPYSREQLRDLLMRWL